MSGLLDGASLARILTDERVAWAAPIAFGDSVEGAPVVGTVDALLTHLSPEIEGRSFTAPLDAVVGAALPYRVGDVLQPAHGRGDAAEPGAHGDLHLTVTGRMRPTGTPWDGAILVPLEGIWTLHGLGDGHGVTPTAGDPSRLGPPYDPALMPGVPAVLVRTNGIRAAYSFRTTYQRDSETMAFFPGAELARLHALMGDVREAMSVMALLSLGLVATAVLCGILIVTRLFRRQLALLAALGAPARFVAAVLWLYAGVHLLIGALAGLALGWLVSKPISAVISARTQLAVTAVPGIEETTVVAAFLGLAALAALVPAFLTSTREPARDLR